MVSGPYCAYCRKAQVAARIDPDFDIHAHVAACRAKANAEAKKTAKKAVPKAARGR